MQNNVKPLETMQNNLVLQVGQTIAVLQNIAIKSANLQSTKI